MPPAGVSEVNTIMIASIYARKSTDQAGVADEQKSVARQVEHAREYADRKGWRIDDRCVFVDDGISGAEFAARPSDVCGASERGPDGQSGNPPHLSL